MLSLRLPEAPEAMEKALLAVETLGLVPETVDALITKGTMLGQVGRLTEARIILEGAIALAEEHDLGPSMTRGQNNLGYTLVGIDAATARASAEAAFRISQRLGDRSILLFQAAQMAGLLVLSGEFEKAEEVLSNPIVGDPPPAVRASFATTELIMASWRGDVDAVDRLHAEVQTLIEVVDDPQVIAYTKANGIEVAIAHDQLEKAFAESVENLDRNWNEVAETVGSPLFIAGLLGERDRFALLVPLYRRFQPRFGEYLTVARLVAEAGAGPVDSEEIDAIIAERSGLGLLGDVVVFSVSAANFLTSEKKAEYVSSVRSIATERGWHGILRLIDRHLT
jgi:hypothetical protein